MGVLIAMVLTMAGTQAQPPATTAEPVAERKICRRTKTTGSRMSEPKRCNTAAEWERLDAAARDQSGNAQVRSRPTG